MKRPRRQVGQPHRVTPPRRSPHPPPRRRRPAHAARSGSSPVIRPSAALDRPGPAASASPAARALPGISTDRFTAPPTTHLVAPRAVARARVRRPRPPRRSNQRDPGPTASPRCSGPSPTPSRSRARSWRSSGKPPSTRFNASATNREPSPEQDPKQDPGPPPGCFDALDAMPLAQVWLASKEPDYRPRHAWLNYDQHGVIASNVALDDETATRVRLSPQGSPHRLIQIVHAPRNGPRTAENHDIALTIKVDGEPRPLTHVRAGPVFGELIVGERVYLVAAISSLLAVIEVQATEPARSGAAAQPRSQNSTSSAAHPRPKTPPTRGPPRPNAPPTSTHARPSRSWPPSVPHSLTSGAPARPPSRSSRPSRMRS
jgi:hypothetical protein